MATQKEVLDTVARMTSMHGQLLEVLVKQAVGIKDERPKHTRANVESLLRRLDTLGEILTEQIGPPMQELDPYRPS